MLQTQFHLGGCLCAVVPHETAEISTMPALILKMRDLEISLLTIVKQNPGARGLSADVQNSTFVFHRYASCLLGELSHIAILF